MGSHLPPQRRQSGGIGGAAQKRPNLSPSQGAQEAAKRLGLACYHAGQKVPGLVGCVACQFQIRNRGVLPACPDCGELVWAWLDSTPPPDVDGLGAPQTEAQATAAAQAKKEEAPPVVVQDNVSIEPT